MASQITRPALRWSARQGMSVAVTVTPRAGLTLADYGTITLTVREDPLWPRSGSTKGGADAADPVNDGWAVATSAAGVIAGSVVTFAVTVPSGAGEDRYAFDCVATGGVAGRVELRGPQFLTVTPTLAT